MTKQSGLIWTTHALSRLTERRFTQHMARETFYQPDKVHPGREKGTTEYQKRFGQSRVTVIAKQNEQHEWIIISCWIDPPLPGTKDAMKKETYRRYQKAGFWKKVWMVILKQLGLLSF